MLENVMPRPSLGIYLLPRRAATLDAPKAKPELDRLLLPVPHMYQQRSLSCEMASLRMAAQYQKVTRSETELVRLMPADTAQPRIVEGKVVWADPNKVFAGNVRGWQLTCTGLRQYPQRARSKAWGYGIYAAGIAEVAAKIGLQAEVFDEVMYVYATLEQGDVPIVIVPCSGRSTSRKWCWYAPDGTAVPAIDGEHAIVVMGYNDQRVWVRDPLGRVSSYERIVFERAFALLTMGVRIGPHVPVVPVPAPPKPAGPADPPKGRPLLR